MRYIYTTFTDENSEEVQLFNHAILLLQFHLQLQIDNLKTNRILK